MMGRPIFAPPNLPAERTRALRLAFEKTMKDTGFIADREAMNEEVNPSSAEEVEALFKTLFETPKELVEETKTIIAAQ